MTLPELMALVGADNIKFQFMTDALSNITSRKKYSQLTIQTQAITPTDVMDGTGPVGLIVWCEREAWDAAVKQMRSATKEQSNG